MPILKFLQEFFGMSAKNFLADWKVLDKRDKEEFRSLGRIEAASQGITINN